MVDEGRSCTSAEESDAEVGPFRKEKSYKDVEPKLALGRSQYESLCQSRTILRRVILSYLKSNSILGG
jgi:hypothetical protein